MKEIIKSKRKELAELEKTINSLTEEEKPDLLKLHYLLGLFVGATTTLNAFEDVNE